MNAQVKDGAVEAKATRNVKMEKEAVFYESGNLKAIVLTFADGSKRELEVPQAVREQALAFGALTRLGGLTAGEDDLDIIKANVEETLKLWEIGEWRERAAGGAGTSIIQKALMEYKGLTANQAADFLRTKTMEQKIAMKRIANLAPIVARLEAEEAARLVAKGKVDPQDESLLEGL